MSCRSARGLAGAVCFLSVVALAGCGLLPGPTGLDRGDPTMAVEYENRSEQRYALTLAEGDVLRGYAEILPCSANGTGMNLAEPFSVGLTRLAPGMGEVTQPGREVVDWTAFREAGGDEFVLVIIEADETVTIATIDERRSIQGGFCP